MPKPTRPLHVDDVVMPWPPYRWVPFGVISLAVWGVLGFTPVMLFLIYLEQGEEVTSSFQGEGLRVWLVFIGVWMSVLAMSVIGGVLLMRRKIIAGPDSVTLRGRFGTSREYASQDLVGVETVYSVATLMQGVLHLRYADGRRRILDGAGFSQVDLQRVVNFLERGRTA